MCMCSVFNSNGIRIYYGIRVFVEESLAWRPYSKQKHIAVFYVRFRIDTDTWR